MADLATLVPRVALYATGAPNPIIVETLRQAAEDFCRRTKGWITEPDSVDIEIGEARYKVPKVGGQIPVKVWELRLDGTLLTPKNMPDWMRDRTTWPDGDGRPDAWAQVRPDEVVLDRKPISAGLLDFKVAVSPGVDFTDLPDWLTDDQGDAFVNGAIGRLLMIPQRTWTNPTLATERKSEYEKAIFDFSWRVAKGFSEAGPSNPARFF